MARQRFIWPSLWTDAAFGRLKPLEQLVYIGCFSNADDEGRLLGDPATLKAAILPLQSSVSVRKVRAARDAAVRALPKLVLYVVDGVEYLAFTNWGEWQKPKYPKPSTFPSPSVNASANGSGNASGIGLGGVGLGREKPLPPEAHSDPAIGETPANYAATSENDGREAEPERTGDFRRIDPRLELRRAREASRQ